MGLAAAAIWLAVFGYGLIYAGVSTLNGTDCKLKDAFGPNGCGGTGQQPSSGNRIPNESPVTSLLPNLLAPQNAGPGGSTPSIVNPQPTGPIKIGGPMPGRTLRQQRQYLAGLEPRFLAQQPIPQPMVA